MGAEWMWFVHKGEHPRWKKYINVVWSYRENNEDQIANKVMKEERMGWKEGEEQESHGWIELMRPSKRERWEVWRTKDNEGSMDVLEAKLVYKDRKKFSYVMPLISLTYYLLLNLSALIMLLTPKV